MVIIVGDKILVHKEEQLLETSGLIMVYSAFWGSVFCLCLLLSVTEFFLPAFSEGLKSSALELRIYLGS